MKSLHEVCVYNCVEIKSEFIRNNLLSSVLMIASQLSIYLTATEGQPKPGGDRTGGRGMAKSYWLAIRVRQKESPETGRIGAFKTNQL